MKDIVLIKLGGSLLTDKSKPYTANMDMITSLSHELSEYTGPLILAHGHGSFAHTSADRYGGKKGYTDKRGITTVTSDVLRFHSIVMKSLVDAGVPAVSFRPSTYMFSSEGKLSSLYTEPFFSVLDQGLIPVVCGDVIWDAKWKTTIYSGETVLTILSRELQKKEYRISRIIEVGETEGVYDKNGKTITSITNDNWPSLKPFISVSKYADVTGGMIHKIEESLMRTKMSIPTVIINGKKKGTLLSALRGENILGTVIE